MPKIQTFQNQIGTSTPTLQNNPANFGGLTAGIEAIGRLGEIGANVANQVIKNERALKVSSASTQAAMEVEQFVFDIKNNDVDYGTQFERYENFAKDVEKRYSSEFEGDPQGLSVFRENIGQLVFKKGFEVRSRSIKGQLDVQKGQLVTNLASLSQLSIQGDDEQREMVNTKAQLMLKDAISNGVIGEEEGAKAWLKYQDQAASAQIRFDIIDNPDQAAEKLLKGQYSGISNEQQLIWLERANSASESRQRAVFAAEDSARREAEREEKIVQEQTTKEGDSLLFNGQLTPGWIEENRDLMDEADYRYFYKALRTDTEGFTDTAIYSDLRFRASNGEDVREEARGFLRKGQLKTADYDKLVNRSEKNIGVVDVPNWFKRGESFLSDTFRVSDTNPDPAAAQRRAIVLDEWASWADENPSPTNKEAREAYQELAESYRLVDSSKMLFLKPLPKFAVGGRQNIDIDSTMRATVEAYRNQEISEQEYNKQAVLLLEWEEAINEMNRGQANAGQ